MSVVPVEIPDVGAATLRLRQNPRFDPMKAGFGTEEYFVWSRFDGSTSLKDLILMTGLAVERAIAIVRALRRAGAILLPGETGEQPAVPPPASASRATTPMPIRNVPPVSSARATAPMPMLGSAPPIPPPIPSPIVATGTAPTGAGVSRAAVDGRVALPLPELDAPTAAEKAVLSERGDLGVEEKVRVLIGLRLVAAADPWALVGVPRDADQRQIKRAYFERSKLFHPDRYFGRELGVWGDRLHTVFEAISSAHGALVDGRGSGRGPRASTAPGPDATAPQSPIEYAAELFDRACQAEVSGDLAGAGKLFAAAVKLDGNARYLRRAASCALAAGEPRTALDYARKASTAEPSDPSTARTLARVLRALDRLDDAEEVLVMALAMKNENDTLQAELSGDLATVRAALRR